VYRSKGDRSHHILLLCNFRRKSLRWHGKDLHSMLRWLSKALWVSVSRIHFYLLSQYNELSLLHNKGAGVFSKSFGSPSFVTYYQLLYSLVDRRLIRFRISAGEDIKHAWFARVQPHWRSQFTFLRVVLSIFLDRCVWNTVRIIASISI
jgi:hypothetical protein